MKMNPTLFSLRLLFLITDEGTEKKIDRLFLKLHLPVYYQFRGQGTAKTEILDICGMQGTTRLFTVSILPKPLVRTVFEHLEKLLRIKKKGNGVAVTVPVNAVQESVLTLIYTETSQEIEEIRRKGEQKMREESFYTMILVAVNEGYSDEVVDAAAKAGAKGGSVIRGRRCGNKAMVQFLGIAMHEEQDFVMIIAPKDKKSSIMNAIGSACGIGTEAHGVVLSVPVDQVLGIREE